MDITLDQRTIDAIVHKLRVSLRTDLRSMINDTRQPQLISTKEAAAILRVTPQRMRQLATLHPDRYPHTKKGGSRQGQLLFDRNALIQYSPLV